jgi:hypothetical protein
MRLLIACLTVPVFCGAVLLWGMPFYLKLKFEKTLQSNDLNRQIFSRNPSWDSKLRELDITDLFKVDSTIDQFVTLAGNSGFHCNNTKTSGGNSRYLICSQSIRYDWVCDRWLVLKAEYTDALLLGSVKADYQMDCL